MGRRPDELDDAPASELGEWEAFERVNGPLLVHDRIDHAAAQISATLMAIATRGEQSVADFLPHWSRTPTPRAEQSAEQMMAAFDRMGSGGKRG